MGTLETLSDGLDADEGLGETDVEVTFGIVEDAAREDGLIVMSVVGFAAGAPDD